MNVHKSKIEWCTHSWNPVSGCLHGCEYCYARRMISRFAPHACEWPGRDVKEVAPGCFYLKEPVFLTDKDGSPLRSTAYPKGFAPTFHAYALDHPERRLIPSRIFVVSMGDLFGEWVPDQWIEDVFAACRRAPQHTYLFLTKNPKRYTALDAAGKLPVEPNFWYGMTVSTVAQAKTAVDALDPLPVGVRTFLSMEPMMEDIAGSVAWPTLSYSRYTGWIIMGAMTGPGKRRHQPKREWVEAVVRDAAHAHIPVFMKDNIKDVWGDELIQQSPDDMVPLEGR